MKKFKKPKNNDLSTLLSEISILKQRILQESPASGTNPLASKTETDRATATATENGIYFNALPLSKWTLDALEAENFIQLTDIQCAALPHALAGRDVLGAAKTGSGKTLAFVIPMIEKLFRERWSLMDGLGALIISPTRELAIQIFEVVRKVGVNHDLSAGLLIGGKDFTEEAQRICSMNILICTPGRLLQHLDQTPGFTADQLQILILDEADRILDMGFEQTMNAIIDHLPVSRQTLLFSATQTKSVKQLARLSLKNPEFLGVTEEMPTNLISSYMTVEAHDKFNVLYGFIKTHLKSKIIVFVSSCKQVRCLLELYKKLHPGILLLSLSSKQSQPKRMAIYYNFVNSKSALLFATDIAARGLDFPNVDWSVQMDCPDSKETYVHRAGRTARYKSSGNSLLMLLPSEEKFVSILADSKIKLQKVKAATGKTFNLSPKFSEFLSEDPDLKYCAQKALVTYLRSIFVQADKSVFDVHAIDVEKLAAAMGLPGTPVLKFLNNGKREKNTPFEQREDYQAKKDTTKDHQDNRIKKLLKRQSATVYAESRERIREIDEDQGDFFTSTGSKKPTFKSENKADSSDEEAENHKVELSEKFKGEKDEYAKRIKARMDKADVDDKVKEHHRVKIMHKEKKIAKKDKKDRKLKAAQYDEDGEFYDEEQEEEEMDEEEEQEESSESEPEVEEEILNNKRKKVHESYTNKRAKVVNKVVEKELSLEEQAQLILKARSKF